MEWSEEHDIILLREMISREIFSFKKGSPDRGKTWESIQEFLNQMENPKFHKKTRSPGQVEYTAGKVLEENEGRRSSKWHRV